MMVIPPIVEHGTIPETFWEQLSEVCFEGNPSKYMGKPKYLGIDSNFTASYYIGASWLVKNELAVIVTPKMKNIDFVTMFLSALEVDAKNESDYYAQCYGIQFDEPTIETDEQLNQLTPLLAPNISKKMFSSSVPTECFVNFKNTPMTFPKTDY